MFLPQNFELELFHLTATRDLLQRQEPDTGKSKDDSTPKQFIHKKLYAIASGKHIYK